MTSLTRRSARASRRISRGASVARGRWPACAPSAATCARPSTRRLSPVRLPYEADRRIRERLRAELERPRSFWSWLFARRGAAFQAAMALLLIFFSIRTTQTLSLPPAAPQETLVLGQDQLAPGRSAALRVLVRTADAALPWPARRSS